jgi:hypothetical protein
LDLDQPRRHLERTQVVKAALGVLGHDEMTLPRPQRLTSGGGLVPGLSRDDSVGREVIAKQMLAQAEE